MKNKSFVSEDITNFTTTYLDIVHRMDCIYRQCKQYF